MPPHPKLLDGAPAAKTGMGVNLRDLFAQHPVPEGWYHGKRVAIDGPNTAFRYLTTIRGRDGDVLRSEQGRATSHIIGFLGLVRHLRSSGAEPILVWDGAVHPRKEATVRERIQRRQDMLARAHAARDAGDVNEYRRLMRSTVYLEPQMIEDCSRLLESLGVAVVTADHDAERYGAAMCTAGHADAVATEDYDALVAGAPHVLRKAGSQAPFLHLLTDLQGHGLESWQLRQVAIVCGTDWHPGIKGFGTKTAAKALLEHGDLRALWGPGDSRAHHLVRASSLSLEEFESLDAYIADLPTPPAPRATKPCPDMAIATAQEIGISQDRVLACFC